MGWNIDMGNVFLLYTAGIGNLDEQYGENTLLTLLRVFASRERLGNSTVAVRHIH